MSKEHFETLRTTLEAIPAAEIASPNIPVNRFLQEAEDLIVWCEPDHAAMVIAGVPQVLLDAIPGRVGALRYAQSLWNKELNTREAAEKIWNEQSPEAYALKNDLEDTFRFAFRKQPDLLARVSAIEAGTGHADLVQDLSDLAVLGRANSPLLEAIGYDLTILDTAEALSGEMAGLLAEMNGTRTEGNTGRVLRDKAYTYLKQALDEVWAAGKFINRRNPDRKKGYFRQG